MHHLVPGSAYVLVARVPRASDRWRQTHFSKTVMEQFFRQTSGHLILERVDQEGFLAGRKRAQIVYSPTNKNFKIEFDFGSVKEYPSGGPPLLLVLELDEREFRYRCLVPDSAGYTEMLQLNEDSPAIGRGSRRVVTTIDEVEMRWPVVRLRNPKSRGNF